MAITPQTRETDEFSEVPEYDIYGFAVSFFNKDYIGLFQEFRNLINDTGNGIPNDIREKLAEIYNATGRLISDSFPATRLVYTLDDVRREIDYELEDYRQHADIETIKQHAQIDTALMLTFLKEAIRDVFNSVGVKEEITEAFDNSVSHDLCKHINKKIIEGALPMLESIDNKDGGDFDIS